MRRWDRRFDRQGAIGGRYGASARGTLRAAVRSMPSDLHRCVAGPSSSTVGRRRRRRRARRCSSSASTRACPRSACGSIAHRGPSTTTRSRGCCCKRAVPRSGMRQRRTAALSPSRNVRRSHASIKTSAPSRLFSSASARHTLRSVGCSICVGASGAGALAWPPLLSGSPPRPPA